MNINDEYSDNFWKNILRSEAKRILLMDNILQM